MEKEKCPLVSVIIPVYNGSNFLKEAIESAINQTYENKEIIVVNDGSTDDGETERIALSFGDRIRYFRKENGGVSSALNIGIKNMRGKYFSWLSHDDLYLPEKIESQVSAMSSCDRQKLIALCGSRMVDADGEEIRSGEYWSSLEPGKMLEWKEVLLNAINNSFSGCALLIPKSAFDEAGLFDEDLRYSQDYLMWMRIFLKQYTLIRTPGSHVCIRVHGNQLSKTGSELFRKDSVKIGNILLEPLADISDKRFNFIKKFALRSARYNNKTVTEMYLKRGKEKGLISGADELSIKLTGAYGKVRPTMRKVYYRVVRGIRTK